MSNGDIGSSDGCHLIQVAVFCTSGEVDHFFFFSSGLLMLQAVLLKLGPLGTRPKRGAVRQSYSILLHGNTVVANNS